MKKNKKFQHYIEYISLKLLISFLHLFSVEGAKKIGFFLAVTTALLAAIDRSTEVRIMKLPLDQESANFFFCK